MESQNERSFRVSLPVNDPDFRENKSSKTSSNSFFSGSIEGPPYNTFEIICCINHRVARNFRRTVLCYIYRRMAIPLPPRIKSAMKLWYRSWRAVYAERVLHFTPDDLRITLESVGVRAGDTLLVHCSFGAFEGFTGNAMHVIRLLQ